MSGLDPMTNDSSGAGFEVYPQALRQATEHIFAARDKVMKFANDDLSSMVLHEDDVGLLGSQSGVVGVFNKVIASLQDKSGRGAGQLDMLAAALDKAADYYETQDEEDFKRLRDKEEGMN
ncbi:hypothetical protein [Amycolatopsis sp. NBC_01480]|jgi:hypothetical protein|uniref:hypothetical protein n=1 Tax=Amycolatopsis sp. NBC_01480 TaxID=2903562 RepID=UPI002E29F379|nr:hypothetical protein [Amycolatopsis sp. NBC_01480]